MEKLNQFITANWKYLSRSQVIQPGQHRLFRVESIRDTYILVMDWELEETFPYKIAEYVEGEFLILKINRKIPSRLEMEDSVLNYLIEDTNTQFTILQSGGKYVHLEVKGSGFSFLCQGNKPIHKNRKKFDLSIKGFDLERNLPIIDHEDFLDQSTESLIQYFDFGKKTRVKVIGFGQDANGPTLTVLHKGKEFPVRGYPFQLEGTPVAEVELLLSLEEGEILLKQDRQFLVQTRYQSESLDSFRLVNRELSPYRKKEILIFEDDFGFRHSLLVPDFLDANQLESFQPGNNYTLWIKDISDNGFMVLFINHLRLNKNSFITSKQLFEDLGELDFYTNTFPLLQNEFTSNPQFNHTSYKNPFDLIKKGENLWILSFGNCLDSYVDNLIFGEKSAEAIGHLKVLIALEEWLLSATDFLDSFKPENQIAILHKAQEQIHQCKTKLEVLLDIQQGNISSLVDQLQLLSDTQEVLDQDTLYKIHLYFFTLPITEVAHSQFLVDLMIKIVQRQPENPLLFSNLSKTLEKHIVHFRSQLNLTGREAYWKKDQLSQVQEKLHLSIRLLALQINLEYKFGKTGLQVHRTCRICRFISLIYWNQEKAFDWLKRSVQTVTTELSLKIPLERITQLEENYTWLGHYFDMQKKASQEPLKVRYKNGGMILREKQNWKIFGSAYQAQVSFNPQIPSQKIACFFDDSLQVHVLGNPKFRLDDTVGATQLSKNWKDYFQGNSHEIEFRSLNQEDALNVEFQSFLSSNSNLGFVKILDSSGFTLAGLHILQVTSVHLNGLEGIFQQGDRFKARFHSSKNQKTQVSVKEDWIEIMKLEAEKTQRTVFKVLMTNNQIGYGMTQEGFFACYNFEQEAKKLEPNKYYIFLPDEVQSHGYDYVQGKIAREVAANFDEKKALRSFMERNILFGKPAEIPKEEENIFFNYIQEVLWSVETMLNFPKISDLTKLSYIYLAKLLSSIQKISKSFYLDEIANYYGFLIRIKEEGIVQALAATKPISPETLRNFPKTTKINKLYELVGFYAKAASREDFRTRIAETIETDEKVLVEFLMAMWILQKQNAISQKMLHRILLTQLSIFGTEGNFQLPEEVSMAKEESLLPDKTTLNLGPEDKNLFINR